MKRILIDANEANVANRVGSNAYAFGLLMEIERQTRGVEEWNFTIALASSPQPDFPTPRPGWQYQVIKSRKFFTQWSLPIFLFSHLGQFDLLYTPGHYAPRLSPIPTIVSIMDLAFLHYPRQFRLKDLVQLKWWTAYSVRKAKHVIAISEATKQDIIKSYRLKADKISVVSPGISPLDVTEKEDTTWLKKQKITPPYILYVGTFQPRKNLIRLIGAFEKLILKYSSELKSNKKKKGRSKSKEAPMQLILAGKTGWLAKPIMKRIANSPYNSHIITPGFITESQKKTLYRHAATTTLVGLYEGFGMPPLEAMQYGVIPVVAKTSSLPEVVGDAGILVDPENETSIMRGLDRVLNLNKKERQKFLQAARTQLDKYTWEKATKKLLIVFSQ